MASLRHWPIQESGLAFGFSFQALAALLHEHGYDPYLMTQVKDGSGTVLLRNEFADGSRVSAQKMADGQVIRYEYLFKGNHDIVETTVTLPGGKQQRFFFKDGKPVKKQ